MIEGEPAATMRGGLKVSGERRKTNQKQKNSKERSVMVTHICRNKIPSLEPLLPPPPPPPPPPG